MPRHPARLLSFSALLAAAALAGCASSDRLSRISPMAEPGNAGRTPLSDDRINLFPFYYGAAGTNAVLWPLIDWDDRGFAFRPVYNREDRDASVLFPFSGWDDSGGWALNTVWSSRGFLFLPLAGKWDGVSFLGPAFWSERDYGFAPIFGRYGDTFQALNVFVTHHPGEARTVSAYPFYYEDKDTTWISELYASTHADGGVTRRSLLGLAYRQYDSDDGKTGNLWALPGWYSSYSEKGRGSFSLLHSEGRDGSGTWFNLHPLWWSASDHGTGREMLLPVYWRRSSPTAASTQTPLWSAGHEGDEKWLNIYPLWWSDSTKTASSETLVPFYGIRRTTAGESVFTLPVHRGEYGESSFFNVYPFWWSDKTATTSHKLLVPFWSEYKSPTGESQLTPLWSYGKEGKESWFNIHPFWWSTADSRGSMRALVPIYYHTADTKGNRDTTSLFYSAGEENGRKWFDIPPLWWTSTDARGSSKTLLPLWHAYETKSEGGQYSPLWSEWHDERNSWFNIHPLWWSHTSESQSSSLLIPVWYSEHDTHGDMTITPLWSYGEGGGRTWFNIHPFWWSSTLGDKTSTTAAFPFWYRTTGISGSTVFTPLCTWGTDKTGEAEFVNVLGFVGHWSDDGAGGVYTHALWPLFGTYREAVGAGESIITPTLIACESSDGYTGFRFTPFVTVQKETSAVKMNRWVPHLVDYRSGKAGAEWYAFPLAYGESHPEGGSEFRITPFVSDCENMSEPDWWSWAHLWHASSSEDRASWSVAAFIGGGKTKDTSVTYVEPFYRHETKDGETTALRAWPVASVARRSGTMDYVCAWSHGTDPAYETRAVFGAIWRRTDENHTPPERSATGARPEYVASRTTVVTPFTDKISFVKQAATTKPMESPIAISGSAFSVDPLWIPLYRESAEGDANSWSVLFGLAGGQHKGATGRDSVLRYLYDREETEEGVRMNCFPFVQNDTLKDREKFSFLWRVFDREKDTRTGMTHGHILFIPY